MKIENTSGQQRPAVKMVVAAEAGNGKTTLARTLQETLSEKVLIISAEAGLLVLNGAGVDYVELQRSWNDGTKAYDEVPKEKRIEWLADVFRYVSLPETRARYQWLFVDSLTEINQNLLELLESLEEFQGSKNVIKKYGELSSRMRSLCKAFRDLPGYNVVFTALVKEDVDQDQKPRMRINMIGQFADHLPALFDEILYLGVLSDVGEDGRNKRSILTQKTDRILFPKDRSGALSRTEPADLGAVVKKIRAAAAKANPLVPDISGQAKQAAEEAKKNEGDPPSVAPVTVEQAVPVMNGRLMADSNTLRNTAVIERGTAVQL